MAFNCGDINKKKIKLIDNDNGRLISIDLEEFQPIDQWYGT